VVGLSRHGFDLRSGQRYRATNPEIADLLGLFTLVINTALFWLTGWLGMQIGPEFGYQINTFWAGLLGALLVSVANAIMTMFFRDELKRSIS
jgi:uncharacterized membrane protein YvlD (DUF360 family)